MSAPKVTTNVLAGSVIRRLGRYIPLILVLLATAVVYVTGWHRALSLETLVGNRAAIDAYIHSHGMVAVLAYVGLYAAVTAGALPAGAVLAVAGGFLFGTLTGGLGAAIGSTLGATILYALARSAFGERIMHGTGSWLAVFAAGFRTDAFYYILFLRLVPSPSWATSMASGSLGVRPGVFVAATALGRLPGSFVFALFGAGFGSVIATQEAAFVACRAAGGEDCRVAFNPADVLTPTLLAGFIGLALLALVPVLARRFLMRRAVPVNQKPCSYMAELLKPNLCVIGAGPAGLDFAMGAAAHGASVVLVERGAIGGRWIAGSLATASLSAAARRARAIREGAGFGVIAGIASVDFARLREHARTVASIAAQNVRRERLAGLGINFIEGTAQFTGRRIVAVGEAVTIRARRFVIATGAASVLPTITGIETVPHLTDGTVLDLREVPRHLVVIGATAHALVVAQALHSFGAAVTVLAETEPLADEDPECARILMDQLERLGIVLHGGVTIARVEAADEGVRVVFKDAAKDANTETTITGSHVLVAASWRPLTDGLGLEAARIKFSSQGIFVDTSLRTSNRRVYAIGDAIGARPSVQAARQHASVAVRNVVFRDTLRLDPALAPRVVATEPALAHVGLDEEAARQGGYRFRVLRWANRETDGAQAERDVRGHIKILTDTQGRVLGATIVGRNAAELIAPWSLAVAQRLDIRTFASAVVPFSTLAEVGNRAAATYINPGLTRPLGQRVMAWLRLS